MAEANSAQTSQENTPRTPWHPPFTDFVSLSWSPEQYDLALHKEFHLSAEPMRIDMLIIRNDMDIAISDPVGSFFSRYNIITYKPPGSSFSVASFYETLSYASQYKTMSTALSQTPDEEFRITAIVDAKPVKLFSYLKEQKGQEPRTSGTQGVYYCDCAYFSMQIVVTHDLDPEQYPYLCALTKRMTDKVWEAFNTRATADAAKDETVKRRIENGVRIIADNNREFFRRREEMMGTFIDDLISERIGDRDNQIRILTQELNTEKGLVQLRDATIQQKDLTIQQLGDKVQQQNATIQQKDATIQQKDAAIQQKDAAIQQKDATIQQRDESMFQGFLRSVRNRMTEKHIRPEQAVDEVEMDFRFLSQGFFTRAAVLAAL